MIAHVVTFEGTPAQLDEITRAIRDEVDPLNAERPGYREGLMLVDRASGSGLLIDVWENADAIDATESMYRSEHRKGAIETTGARRTSVRTYEVASHVSGRSPANHRA